MTDLFAARMQMAFSLGFHIIFAVVGMAMPLLMVISELKYLRSRDPIYRELAHRWAKGTAIIFAVGAVSGTVLSFELGLLWPPFMELAGPLVGLPFGLEGFAFFLEAIALGVYIYGWNRVHPWVHLGSGGVVALAGMISGVFVVSVNGFMNTPDGFRLGPDGEAIDIRPWDAFFNAAWPTEALHMVIAAYQTVAFAVLGIHAWRLLSDPDNPFHRRALHIAFAIAVIAAPLQIVAGDLAAGHVAREQPQKLAAAEGQFETERGAGLTIFGWPDVEEQRMGYRVAVPNGLSLLAFHDPDAEVLGLKAFPEDTWPPVVPVYLSFRIMVACGLAMLGVALWGGVLWLKRRTLATSRAFLKAAVVAAPLGIIAVETGWTVTEVGRQPWIIRDVMRTADALTPMPNLWIPFAATTAIYLFLGVIVALLMRAHVFGVPRTEELREMREERA